MAARLTNLQKQKIVADYLNTQSYRAAGRLNGVSDGTVRRIVGDCSDFAQKAAQKKQEDTADIIAYMESRRRQVCDIIEIGLDVLPKKIKDARSASEVTTAIGTLIDKFTAFGGGPADGRAEDGLSQSLKELAKELKSDDSQ